ATLRALRAAGQPGSIGIPWRHLEAFQPRLGTADTLAGMDSVADIMTREVATAHPDSPLADAVTVMAERVISCIVATEAGRPVGVMSERDLVRKVVAAGADAPRLRVRDVMPSPVVAVPAETTALEALERLRGGHFRRLPVIDPAGALIGIVTQTDLLRGLL